jgi:hypothetical protein
MNMQTNVARLRDAADRTKVHPASAYGMPELEAALRDVDNDVRQSQALMDAVLAYHDDNHAGAARFCSAEPCRLAAEW